MLQSSLKRSFPRVATLLATVAVCACLVYAANLHERMVLRFPTAEQKLAARELNDEAFRLIDELTNAFDDFCEDPTRETELGERFITTSESFSDFHDREHDNPLKWIVDDDVVTMREKSDLAGKKLNEAADRFLKEILCRRADPEFEIDEQLYQRMAISLAREPTDRPARQICERSNCIWCAINGLMKLLPF